VLGGVGEMIGKGVVMMMEKMMKMKIIIIITTIAGAIIRIITIKNNR
jgi:hypothetical protein